jgi:TP901 family phage tail tape measure protein
LAASVKIFAGFADKMAEVRAVTGASTDQFAKLEATAKQLGATTSFTASQVADGMKFLGMAGFDTEQILAGIPAVLN